MWAKATVRREASRQGASWLGRKGQRTGMNVVPQWSSTEPVEEAVEAPTCQPRKGMGKTPQAR